MNRAFIQLPHLHTNIYFHPHGYWGNVAKEGIAYSETFIYPATNFIFLSAEYVLWG